MIDVLDKGYIRLTGVHGTEADIVNAARISFNREIDLDENGELFEVDQRLIKFLLRNNHLSPFRHVHLGFEVYAPLMVVRQHVKHIVGSSFIDEGVSYNEVSKRYVVEEDTFHIPDIDKWRSAPENKKQGSGDDLSADVGELLSDRLAQYIDLGQGLYESAISLGAAPEQARLFLPAYGMYVRYRWNISLHGMFNFLAQRLDGHAQYEIREYAKAFESLTEQAFPFSYNAWRESNEDND